MSDYITGRGGQVMPYNELAAADDTTTPTQATAIANGALPDYGLNVVLASAADDDAVALPPCKAQAVVIVKNADAAQDIEVWPNTGDSINGGSANAKDGTALGEGAARWYFGDDTGTNWVSVPSVA